MEHVQGEQVGIAADDEVRATRYGAGQHRIVARVLAHGIDRREGFGQSRDPQDIFNHGPLVLGGESQLRIAHDPHQFIHQWHGDA